MGFVKKFLVLKESAFGYSVNGKGVSGVARAESENGRTALSLSLINLASLTEGEYVAVFVFGGATRFESLGVSPFSLSFEYEGSVSDGFACAVAHAADGKVTPVVAGACAETGISADTLARLLHEKYEIKNEGKNKAAAKDQVRATETYDDETVATENYYLKEDADPETLTVKDDDERNICKENLDADSSRKDEEHKREEKKETAENARSVAYGKPTERYYERVRSELEQIFAEHPEDHSLDKTLPDGKWVRVAYSQGKYYVVGLIFEQDKPKYICYGVPARYSAFPPKELAGYCGFIPLSVFDMRGDGYWMMFQDAETGECVHPNG